MPIKLICDSCGKETEYNYNFIVVDFEETRGGRRKEGKMRMVDQDPRKGICCKQCFLNLLNK